MAEALFDPEKQQLDILKDAAGQPHFRPENPISNVKKCCEIIRELCRKRGIPEEMVPCVHRLRLRFRYWDLRRGRTGASHKCTLLCGQEWRLATVEEVTAQHKKWEEDRQAAMDEAKREVANKVAIEAVASAAMQQANKLEAGQKRETEPAAHEVMPGTKQRK